MTPEGCEESSLAVHCPHGPAGAAVHCSKDNVSAMTATRARRASMDSTAPAHSPSTLRKLRQSLVDKLERLRSPSSDTTRSSVSSQSFDEDCRSSLLTIPPELSLINRRALQRVEAVRIQHSIRKHDHRYYVVHVYLRNSRTPIYKRDPDYMIETTYASFFALRDSAVKYGHAEGTACQNCSRRVEFLREHRESVHDLNRILRTPKEKEGRLEMFLHYLLGFSSDDEQVQPDVYCIGCEKTMELVAKFVRPKYESLTGVI